MIKVSRKQAIVLHDLVATILAWQAAWWLRFNLDFPFFNWQMSIYSLPLVLLVQALVFKRFKLHKGLWRFASLPDLWNIFRACLIGALSITLVFFMWNRLEGIPRSILVLYPIMLMFFLGGPRLTYRMWKDHSLTLGSSERRKNVLVIGAGAAADMLVRDILREGSLNPVAFVDDSARLIGTEIHGVEVAGDTSKIEEICKDRLVDIIIIAIPSATSQQMQDIVSKCESTDCPIRILPSTRDTVSGKVAVKELREVLIEDLLGRDKIKLDWDSMCQGLGGKCILVTGGGGSIGSELCRQLTSLKPEKLIVFDHSEYNLYKLEQSLGKYDVDCEFVLGNISERNIVDQVLDRYKPQIIFQACANTGKTALPGYTQ